MIHNGEELLYPGRICAYEANKILKDSDYVTPQVIERFTMLQSLDQNGLDGSYLDCYMNEHQNITTEETQRHVAHMISNEWKRLNQES
ncbi:terpene synthase family, metal-binding domain protein [Medicago truncatula]|uniref:Terpene synthase family, metal-binding domain protein n=1 Tax=Medicago truncatula TaxID=3880 RepID=G7IK33_MEDTR|nr:terpene synthase family, metal-binding domain protein [Medicago truncatula]